MKLFDPRTWFGGESKASLAGPVIAAHYVGQPVWTPRDYERLAAEAYTLNPIAYRCVKIISQGASGIPWLIERRGGAVLDEHPMLDLLRRPNPMNGGKALFEALYAYELLAGNSYLEAVGPETGAPRELWVLRPDRMKVIAGKYGVPSRYKYEHAGLSKEWPVNMQTGQSPRLLHVREFHPTDDWYGLSRVEPGARATDRNNAAAAHNMALLQNGARPSGALIYEAIKGADGAERFPPAEVLSKARERFVETYGSPENSGKPMVLAGNVRWQEMAITPKDMDFADAKDDSSRDICAAFGVPHVLLVRGDATYNNVREAKLELYEQTVLPLAEHFTDELNNWLAPRFGDGLKLTLDYDRVTALEPRREARRESVTALLERGVLHRDEARDELGYGDLPPDTVMAVDAGTVAALQALADDVGPEPLLRYLKSVGLLPEGFDEAQAAEAALALDPDELADAEPPAPDQGEDETEAERGDQDAAA